MRHTPSPDTKSDEAELEDLLSDLSGAQGRTGYHWWELGTNPPAAINAGLASGRLELVEVQPDWYEHPHHVGCFIRIQNGKIGPPGVVALRKEVECSILGEIAEKKMPMFLRGEFRLTEDEKHRRIFRSEIERQAALDEGRRRKSRKSSPERGTPELRAAISRRLAAGERPGTTVQRKTFCDSVRNDCDGWANLKLRTKKRRHGDKTIDRIVEELLTPQSKTAT